MQPHGVQLPIILTSPKDIFIIASEKFQNWNAYQ